MANICEKCKNAITEEEFLYSLKYYNKALCKKDQPTTEARKLGEELKKNGNWDVVYERFDGYKHVDLSIPSARVDIEVDGRQHTLTADQALRDLKRTHYSYKNEGYFTLRIPNVLLRDDENIKEAVRWINDFLHENQKDVASSSGLGYFEIIKNKISKRKFALLIGVFGMLVGVGLLFLAEFSDSKLFNIPVFESIWMLTKYVWEFFWAFLKMFWTVFTSSWLSVIVLSGFIIFFFLARFYNKHY